MKQTEGVVVFKTIYFMGFFDNEKGAGYKRTWRRKTMMIMTFVSNFFVCLSLLKWDEINYILIRLAFVFVEISHQFVENLKQQKIRNKLHP